MGKSIMTQRMRKKDHQGIKEECYAFMDVLPQFVWLMQPDGSLIYTNQRWRDYSHRLSQRAGEQEGFERQQRDDCLLIQERQRTRPHADALSEKEIWLQNLHSEDKERVLELQRQAFIRGEPYKFEYRLRDGQTGTYRWFFSQHVPLRNKAGQLVQWVGTCTDINDQKRTEEALRESQERASALMDSSIIGINIAEGEQIVDANDAFLHMTGYTREDLRTGKINWMHMTPPDHLDRTVEAHQELADKQAMMPYEKEYVCKDGNRLPVLVGRVTLEHHPHQAIGFMLDNSARRELEQRKDAFLGMVSHELKTPLASLKLQTQLLCKKLGKQGLPNMEAVCVRMDAQLNAITRLVDELLDISHIQAGTLEYAQDTVDLDELLEEVVDVIQGMHTTHTIAVQHAASPALVDGDRDRLTQVFQNVLSNAIKYAPDAPLIDVVLTTEASAVTISVRDQGIGIPRELHGRVFERFYRAVSLQQRAFPGLGMGLYIVAEIVKHHGGTIRVESEKGKGSTFHLRFPLAASRDEVSEAERKKSDGQEPTGRM